MNAEDDISGDDSFFRNPNEEILEKVIKFLQKKGEFVRINPVPLRLSKIRRIWGFDVSTYDEDIISSIRKWVNHYSEFYSGGVKYYVQYQRLSGMGFLLLGKEEKTDIERIIDDAIVDDKK